MNFWSRSLYANVHVYKYTSASLVLTCIKLLDFLQVQNKNKILKSEFWIQKTPGLFLIQGLNVIYVFFTIHRTQLQLFLYLNEGLNARTK